MPNSVLMYALLKHSQRLTISLFPGTWFWLLSAPSSQSIQNYGGAIDFLQGQAKQPGKGLGQRAGGEWRDRFSICSSSHVTNSPLFFNEWYLVTILYQRNINIEFIILYRTIYLRYFDYIKQSISFDRIELTEVCWWPTLPYFFPGLKIYIVCCLLAAYAVGILDAVIFSTPLMFWEF